MAEDRLEHGTKASKTVAGAPFAPAEHHDDRQDRPRRVVPTAVPEDGTKVADEPVSGSTDTSREEVDRG
jgi:hypothetical protein